jgi:hypothetical protein
MRLNWFMAAMLGVSLLGAAQQQQPKVLNAQFNTEPVGAGLSATVGRFQHSNGPLWLGYEVRAVPGSRFHTCPSDTGSALEGECCGIYRLESANNDHRYSDEHQPGDANIDILVRVDQGMVDKVRFINSECRVDAGGLPFTWLTDASEDDSVAWLSSLVNKDNQRHTDEVLAAIAVHGTGKATVVLESLSSSVNPLWLREKASFWLGAERGHDGYLALKKLASDPDPEFRKKLSFDLFVSHDASAVDDLIQMAKSDPEVSVREQSIFWVGQKAGAKAVAMLKDTVQNDPEVAVKKKAVFALSQLPKGEAVPELLHVAQTNPNPEVRKDAIFWLGQTHDPRALAYFEQILER